MSQRNRREVKELRKYYQTLDLTNGCEFCKFPADQIIEETKYFIVVKNMFPYSVWDEMGVVDHLMAIPKQHTDTLSDLSDAAAVEFVKLISDYEKRGYNVYARAPGSRMKSIVHQHTHLIKDDKKHRKVLVYTHKPYMRIAL